MFFVFKYRKNNKEEIIIYDKMKQESTRLEAEINELQKRLATMPQGKLICARNGNQYKWYRSDGHQKIYIPKKNRKFAEQLATKKYLSVLLEDLLHEKSAIDSYLRHHHSDFGKAEKMLTEESEYQKLLSPIFTITSEELDEWSHMDYETNTKYPEQLIHRGASGIKLRSKSESIIDIQLYTNGIPFRYECALHLGDMTFYPDFTIRHPRTGKIYYWEHFGMMDKPAYVETAAGKIQQYMLHGIIPSVQLITTYETKDNPLGFDKVKRIIEEYFL